MARQWCAPRLRRLSGEDAVLALAARELHLHATRRDAFGPAAARHDSWTRLIALFLVQAGRPVEDGFDPHDESIDMAEMQERALVERDAASGRLVLTAEGVERLRTHFGTRVLDEVGQLMRAALRDGAPSGLH